MAQQDLQIGNVLTEPEHRGRGLATLAICKVVELMARQRRTFWYLTAEDNRPSIRAVERAGFRLAGVGTRERPFSFSPFARYLLSSSARSEA
jgi:RimJ/RimL family protein N-acetyltransferase